jgi:hypothetical protein
LEAETIKARKQRDTEDDRLRFLHLQADAGSREAAVAAKRLEIQRQFNEERQRLKELEADKTDLKRSAQATDALSKIDKTENAALKLNAGAYDPTPQIAERQDAGNGGLSGLVQNARERAFLNRPHLDVLGAGIGGPGDGGRGGKSQDANTKATEDLTKSIQAMNEILKAYGHPATRVRSQGIFP